MKWFKFGAIAVIVVLGSAGVVAFLLLVAQNKEQGITSLSLTQLDKIVTQPNVSGKTYLLTDEFAVTPSMRFSTQQLPKGWHVAEDSGNGSEAAVYNLETDDKTTTVKTTNLSSALAAQYESTEKCSQELAQRYSSSSFIETYFSAAPGTVTTGTYMTYVVSTNDGNGVEMGRVDYSYKNANGATVYGSRLLRCGSNNVLTINVSGLSEQAVMGAVVTVVKSLVLKS